MKLVVNKPNIESSETFQAQMFSIGDASVVFDILRSKLYSDPIKAICREISCNARDAHREVGKFNVPCQIALPNHFSPSLKIKDFGPGISPDRIENIFTKYGCSTKREDNIQTGAFGIGSKVSFSYTDTFNVTTIFDGVKYNYSCYIDETRVGKLALLSSEKTSEPSGTEIIIPVKKDDFYKFADDVEYVTRHWEVRPIITGGTIEYQDITPNLKGHDYAICRAKSNNYVREVKLIIDGIEYPVDLNKILDLPNAKIVNSIYGTFYLYFGIGELTLSASREAIHIDKQTLNKISDKLGVIIKDIEKDVQKEVDSKKSLWDANVWFNRDLNKTLSNHYSFLNITWHGKKLTDNNLDLGYGVVYAFTRGKRFKKVIDNTKFCKTIQNSIYFNDNTKIFLCDLAIPDVHVKHVSKAFEDPDVKYVYVVKPTSTSKQTIDDIEKKHDLKSYGAENLSTIAKPGKIHVQSGPRLLVYKFDSSESKFNIISHADMELDSSKKILCMVSKKSMYNNHRSIYLLNGKVIQPNTISDLLQVYIGKNMSVYAVDEDTAKEKIVKSFPNAIWIDDCIKKIVDANMHDIVQMYNDVTNYEGSNMNYSSLPKVDNVDNPNSLYLKYLNLLNNIKDSYNENLKILNFYKINNGAPSAKEVKSYLDKNPDRDISTIRDSVYKTYPLLSSFYSYHMPPANHISHYINLIDKEILEKS